MKDITDKASKHAYLLNLIPHGKDNAILGRDLENVLKIDPRTRYSLIESARRDGLIICACDRGYYQPETHAEMLSYYETAHARAVSILSTLKATRRELVKNGVKVR